MSRERWFRFYGGVPFDPKQLQLSDRIYRLWTYLLCFACDNDGTLPSIGHMALMLRMKPSKLSEDIQGLIKLGLMDETGEQTVRPHNWNGRQYKNDVSTERVKRFRERKTKPDETVSVNAPENRETESPPTPPGGDDDEFEEFYRAYPLHKGRGQAVKAYRTARKKISAEALLEAARRWAVVCVGKEPKFVAYPATWLNGERWTDEDVRQGPVLEWTREERHRFATARP